MKCSEVLEKFIIEEQTRGCTDATIRHYKVQIKAFINFYNGDINNLTYTTYQEYVVYLRNKYKESSGFEGKKQPLSGRTIKTYVSALKTFLIYAYDEGYMKENVGHRIKMPRYKKKVIEILNMKEIGILINSFDKTTFNSCRDLLVVSIMLETGARLSEVTNLKKKDFNFEDRNIKIDGKGQKERLVPLTEFIQSCYKIYIYKYYDTFHKELNNDDYLIRTQENEPATKNTISLAFRRIRNRINIDIHPHLLRHTFATWFLLNGGDIVTLQVILGHTTLNMVLNYLHLANQINLSMKMQYTPLSNMRNPIGQKNN